MSTYTERDIINLCDRVFLQRRLNPGGEFSHMLPDSILLSESAFREFMVEEIYMNAMLDTILANGLPMIIAQLRYRLMFVGGLYNAN
jgi:hypothetical protein